jgi:hypothetical protein
MKIDLTDEEMNWLYQAMDCNYALLPHNPDRFYDSFPEVIKQKIVATFKLDYTIMKASGRNKYCEEPHFSNHKLFLGSGIHSVNDAAMAHKRLAYAIMMLGGLQQPGHPETKEQAEQEEAGNLMMASQIKHALRDVIAAFGYKPEELNDVSE